MQWNYIQEIIQREFSREVTEVTEILVQKKEAALVKEIKMVAMIDDKTLTIVPEVLEEEHKPSKAEIFDHNTIVDLNQQDEKLHFKHMTSMVKVY